LTSSSASLGIEGIVNIFLRYGVSGGRDERQAALLFFQFLAGLCVEPLRQVTQKFLLLCYRKRLDSGFNFMKIIHAQRLSLSFDVLQRTVSDALFERRALWKKRGYLSTEFLFGSFIVREVLVGFSLMIQLAEG